MKLKKLEITGFKSFMGKTRIVFPPGTTGVVGPNGCGKSNVVDALRWVMGEQNVRKLRGKTSEDIIFAGSAGHSPLNMAEVSLTIDNDDASIVGPFNEYSEITVTRRLFRSGESNYLINRQPARLKDIQALFLGTGTGKNAFAVIQQGNIGALTDATPEERRVFIEEAADVTKYKARKRETEAKIKSTRENLARVRDIISELEHQLGSLKSQAKKAQYFKELQKGIRDLDITLAGVEFLTLRQKAQELSTATEGLKQQAKVDLTRREAISSALARLKLLAQETTDAIEAHNRKIFELKRLADRDKNDSGHLKEKALTLTREVEEDTRHLNTARSKNRDLSDEIASIHTDHGDLDQVVTKRGKKIETAESYRSTCQARLTRLEKESHNESSRRRDLVGQEASVRHLVSNAEKLHDSATRKLKRRDEERATAKASLVAAKEKKAVLDKEMTVFKEETAELNAFLENLQDGITAVEIDTAGLGDTLKKKEIEESRIRSFLETMQRMIHNHEGYGDGVKEGVIQLDTLGSTQHEVVADLIQVKKGFEAAAETVLGEILTHIVVHSSETALQGAQAMLQEGTSRCGFLAPGLSDLPPFTGAPLDGCRPLSGLITLDERLPDPLPALLSRFFVADDLPTAIKGKGQANQLVAIATIDGNLVDFSGAVIAGKNGASASLLKRRTEMNEAEATHSGLEADIARLSTRREGLQKELETRRDSLRQAESEGGRLRRDQSKKERACLLAGEEVKQGEKHLTLMDLGTEPLEGDLADLETEMEESRKKRFAVQKQLAQRVKGEKIARETLAEAREALSQADQVLMELKLALVREEARHENHRSTLQRLTGFLKEGEALIQRLHVGIQTKTRESETCLQQAEKKEKGLGDSLAAVSSEEEALAITRTRFSRFEANMSEKETEQKELATAFEDRCERLRKEDVNLAGFLTRGEELKTRILAQYRTPVEELTSAFQEEIQAVLKGETSKETLKQDLTQLKRKISQLVDVNPAAVTQYKEVKERHGFLFEQQTDLTSSLDDLEAIIRKINRITQERFVDTFHRINEKLEEIFPRLFEGGSARLVLTDPAKPLETGVELMIHPPGKKQARLSLLSGGEKALSAIAFVFSIFLLKPSSFCVMDEIDAPLDDANVLRFNNLLTMIAESSQILVITHNKITMEHADILIGVTMEKKGISKVVSVNLSGKELPFEAHEAESA